MKAYCMKCRVKREVCAKSAPPEAKTLKGALLGFGFPLRRNRLTRIKINEPK